MSQHRYRGDAGARGLWNRIGVDFEAEAVDHPHRRSEWRKRAEWADDGPRKREEESDVDEGDTLDPTGDPDEDSNDDTATDFEVDTDTDIDDDETDMDSEEAL